MHFAEVNKNGRGIRSGLGICACNDMIECTCGPKSLLIGNGGQGGSSGFKEGKTGHKMKKDRDTMPVVSDARKGKFN